MNIWLRFLHLINSVTLGTIRRVQEAPAFRPVILGCFFNARAATVSAADLLSATGSIFARAQNIYSKRNITSVEFRLMLRAAGDSMFLKCFCVRTRKKNYHTVENFCPRLTEINYLRIQLRECQKGVVMNRFGWIDGATESDSPPATNIHQNTFIFCGLNGLLMKEDIHT